MAISSDWSFHSVENKTKAISAKTIPNPCFKLNSCLRKIMQNIKVIMGYIEVTKTTGMVGPLRNAKIKKYRQFH